MEISNTKDFILKECEKNITRRPEKINHLDECLAFHRQYDLMKSEPGSPHSNRILAEQAGMSRRAFLYKKAIGRGINKNLRRTILQNPALNHFKFLLALSRLPQIQQETILHRVLTQIRAGKTIQQAMVLVGLKKKQENEGLKIPAGHTAILVQKEVAEKGKLLEAANSLSLSQQIEHFIFMEAFKKERGKNNNNLDLSHNFNFF